MFITRFTAWLPGLKIINNKQYVRILLTALIVVMLIVVIAFENDTLPRAAAPIHGEKSKTRVIYVASHGWHTGVIVDAETLESLMPQLHARFASKLYLEIGWGDAGFYQAKEITADLVMQAVFWPTESVVHVVGFSMNPVEYFDNSDVREILVGTQQYESLLTFLKNSFAKNESGQIISMHKGIYGDSQFYRGVGKYYLFNTCNKWTAKALYSAGMDITPMFKLTASSVMASLDDLQTFKTHDE